MDKKELKITLDGSHTLYVPHLNESYHSTNGAIQESEHIYIRAGLNNIQKKKIKILEVGFGTGLNAFLTLLESSKRNIDIKYLAIEAFPLEQEFISQLNYTKELKCDTQETKLFNLLHKVEWESDQKINDQFRFKKNKKDLKDYRAMNKFDIIYFDAFGPEVQPQLWTKEIFEQLYHSSNEGGILVTYCAKGTVKRALKEVGFVVENLPGPPGKREITRGRKL